MATRVKLFQLKHTPEQCFNWKRDQEASIYYLYCLPFHYKIAKFYRLFWCTAPLQMAMANWIKILCTKKGDKILPGRAVQIRAFSNTKATLAIILRWSHRSMCTYPACNGMAGRPSKWLITQAMANWVKWPSHWEDHS